MCFVVLNNNILLSISYDATVHNIIYVHRIIMMRMLIDNLGVTINIRVAVEILGLQNGCVLIFFVILT